MDERLSRPWSHPVVFNMGPLEWESSALTTRPLLHCCSIVEIVEQLKAVKENVNITFIIEFIDNILAKILHHCNHLQHF